MYLHIFLRDTAKHKWSWDWLTNAAVWYHAQIVFVSLTHAEKKKKKKDKKYLTSAQAEMELYKGLRFPPLVEWFADTKTSGESL